MEAQAIIEAMRAGAVLYQEGNNVWYLTRINQPREYVDARVCQWLLRRDAICEEGNDESPSYERGWMRWYILGKPL
jgi:hypothetical protein